MHTNTANKITLEKLYAFSIPNLYTDVNPSLN